MKPPWTVEWTADALDSLTRTWLLSPNPQEINAAQERVDYLLERWPLDHGEEVSEGLRRLVVPPLQVLYSVNEEQKSVEVSAVRLVD